MVLDDNARTDPATHCYIEHNPRIFTCTVQRFPQRRDVGIVVQPHRNARQLLKPVLKHKISPTTDLI